jgi:hypothetical protein
MPLKLDDEQCLLWIKDPSISPFVNKKTNKRRFIFDNNLDNPKEIFNTVKDTCFYNYALRSKIIEQINEYKKNNTQRLYILNDKNENIEYITPPFTQKECERWLINHLENPRPYKTTAATTATAATKVYDKITVGDNTYLELIYASIQYNLPIPSNSNDYINSLIEDVKKRFEIMKKNDNFFLNHDVGSFDKRLKINDIVLSKKPKANDSFDVSSSSSYKSFKSTEKRQLRDMILMNEKRKKLVKEYQYKKELMSKKVVDKKVVDNLNKFYIFKKFIEDLKDNVMNGQLINNILKDATEGAKARITVPIDVYLRRKKYDESSIQNILKENNYDTIEGVISNFINNIYEQLIDPETEFFSNLEIGCLSYSNKEAHFKNAELIKKISNELFNFTKEYSFIGDDKIKIFFIKYFINLVEDTIPRDFVKKRKLDVRTNGNYINCYYKLIYFTNKEPKKIRLPEGMGLLIGKELTNAIKDLDEPYFNDYKEDRVLSDDNPVNGFTYEECKKWVTLPVINPRTFKQILIDSPIYNRLLCMSYQYNTKLIPRMITSRGYYILLALTNVIENILRKEKKIAQSRDQLENYIIDKEAQYTKKKEEKNIVSNKIGLKWKNVGTKHPKGGIKIINEKITHMIIKSISTTNKLPFYIFLTEEDLEKIGSSTIITKNSYIEITTYYIPDVPIVNRTSSSKIGLKWKRIGVKYPKEGEGIKKEGIEIINKKLTEALLKLNDTNNNSPSSFIFREEDLVRFGITTAIAKNSYIKITYYYMPVADKSFSDFIYNPKSNVVITNRNLKYSINKYYTIADCLRWANQPNRDPIIPDKIFKTDSPEYNIIFEQALLYDYDITPINITSKGIKFMNSVIKIKEKLLTIADKPKFPTSRGKYIEDINTKMCIAINNIYDDETNDIGKKYKKFKNKMIEKCEKYNKDSFMCIKDIRNLIEDYFYSEDNHAKKYEINYYQDSALASLLIFYEDIKNKIYNEEFRDIFIHDFNKFYVYIYEIDDELNENRKDAIDAGGPKREFYTKLFEELFCDDEHLTRPFISPNEIINNKYCINPNFVPDENFRKVIEAYKTHTSISKFNTERDYEYIYFVIGKLLCLTVVNEMIGLPKQFSTYILAGLINQPYELNKYDMLYFYLRDFHNATSYINMISKSSKIDDLSKSYLFFNDIYAVSKASQKSSGDSSGEQINKDNCIKFILQLSKHVVAKNCLVKEKINSEKSMKKRYDSLFGGFSNEIRKFLYRKKITIEQLSLLITNEQLTVAILRELVSKLEIYMEIKYTPNSFIGVYTGSKMSDAEQKERCDELKGYISNIIIQRRQDETETEHINFVKKLLRFWTGLTYYDKTQPYKICYKYGYKSGVGININNLPLSHTCMYTLDIFGFHVEDNPAEREKFIYDKIKLAVGEQEMELH